MMTIAQIMEKMIAFSEGNIHDITHLSCVKNAIFNVLTMFKINVPEKM